LKHLLIIDDEPGSRQSLRAVFSRMYDITLAADAEEARLALSEKRVDLVLLDVMMPGKDGLSILRDIQSLYPQLPVIMVSGTTSVQPVVQAIKEGACDFITKPFDIDQIRMAVARALQSSTLQRKVQVLQTELSREYPIDHAVGESPAFRRAMEDARKAAETDATVLIYGESGTGKELLARSVHAWSSRRDDPFVPVHCGALPETLMESELFGYEKGAFTGADRQKSGRFDLAGSGTLFFDEVSEMTPATQVKLLRVLQEREFMRVGGTRVIRTDARIIAATNRDLRQDVQEKKFREDLFYRLSVVPVRIPPLRERNGDIALLADHFFRFFQRRLNCNASAISLEAMRRFCAYSWPGNVRELRNIIERILVLHGKAECILPEHLPEEFHSIGSASSSLSIRPVLSGNTTLEKAVNDFERALIAQALVECGGIQTAAARRLGTTRRILKYRMGRLDIRIGGQGVTEPRPAKRPLP
jgi:DNA-binding NtrC family response regulator